MKGWISTSKFSSSPFQMFIKSSLNIRCNPCINLTITTFKQINKPRHLKKRISKLNTKLITNMDVIGIKTELCSFSIRISKGNRPNQLNKFGIKVITTPTKTMMIPAVINIFPISIYSKYPHPLDSS